MDQEPCHRVSGQRMSAGMMPLDQLLTADLEDTISIASSHHDVEIIQEKLNVAVKRNDHLTELVNESEAHVMRLTEQAKILKEEIRRLERNTERETETRNMEYLKNILLKFLTLGVGDERNQLVPVMTTMLKLSPEEKDTIVKVAQGEEASSAQQPSGWGSYLHRWSGLT